MSNLFLNEMNGIEIGKDIRLLKLDLKLTTIDAIAGEAREMRAALWENWREGQKEGESIAEARPELLHSRAL